MAVTVDVDLQEQPASGLIQIVPLAGNGYTAPKSMYLVDVNLTQDGSGGVAAIRVTRDDRFEHIVAIMAGNNTNTSVVAIQFDIQLVRTDNPGPGGPSFSISKIPSLSPGVKQLSVFIPPPLINPVTFNCRCTNVDTFTLTTTMVIYNFNIDASKITPLSVLLASIPSGGSFN